MALILYDTLSGKKKPLKPRSGSAIEIFVCGPTVYNYSHIGHARTYIAFDAFVKYLRSKDHAVRYVQNITNIDDKIIDRARELNETPENLARTFETEYFHDMESLGIDSVDRYARATDYIKQIISQTDRLMQEGFAYEIPEDGIYFDISKFRDYGKLSHRTTEQAEDSVSRIDESVQKRNKGDFALWKFTKPDEPKWPSPWGEGRPGWHIEDTAITETEFGAQYDIHGGARDLIFPHHEAEVAQMEAVSGIEPLVNFWMHTGFLTINGQKMSKSLGNFITIHEFLEKHSKEVFRLFILSSHYRSAIDYDESAIEQAEANVKRLSEFYQRLKDYMHDSHDPSHKNTEPQQATSAFFSELDDDFNTPKALAALFELIREGNSLLAKHTLRREDAAQILEFLHTVQTICGIIPEITDAAIPQEVLELAQTREKLRKNQKWEEADEIRFEIEKSGFTLKDTPHGPEIKKA